MKKNRFSKPVAFNSNQKIDQQILEHVKKRNFSGYVKKLILADMTKNNVNEPIQETNKSKLEQLQEKLRLAKDVNSNSDKSTNS